VRSCAGNALGHCGTAAPAGTGVSWAPFLGGVAHKQIAAKAETKTTLVEEAVLINFFGDTRSTCC